MIWISLSVWLTFLVNKSIIAGYVATCYNQLGNIVSCPTYTSQCRMSVYKGTPYTYAGGCDSSCTDYYGTTQITYCCFTNNCNSISVATSFADDEFNPSNVESGDSGTNSSGTSSTFPWYLFIIIPFVVLIFLFVMLGPLFALLAIGITNRNRMMRNGRPYGPWYNHVRMGPNSLVGQAVVTTSPSMNNGIYTTPSSYAATTTSYTQPGGLYSMPIVQDTGLYSTNAYNPQFNATSGQYNPNMQFNANTSFMPSAPAPSNNKF